MVIMNERKLLRFSTVAIVLILICLVVPGKVSADGFVPNPEVRSWIDEGQQIAVIYVNPDGSAEVHLFISLYDNTQESHLLTFYLPLGFGASDFQVAEESSTEFESVMTSELDDHILDHAVAQKNYQAMVRIELLLGPLLTNGIWSWAIALPIFLTSCGGGPAPAATFETDSSHIDIYDMDAETDIQALVETAGLHPSVTETLERLRGQQIAVIELQTQPKGSAGSGSGYSGEPGIHLTWKTDFVSQSEESIYSYPLGTGETWVNPIELTQVYIVAPPGVDFEVDYPQLGEELSGLSGLIFGYDWKIEDTDNQAYAVDEAFGDFGRIWRVTYVDSNPSQDIAITFLGNVSAYTKAAIRKSNFQDVVLSTTWIVALVVAASTWLVNWRWIMKWRLGRDYGWRDGRLWNDAWGWSLLYLATNIIVAGIAALIALAFNKILLLILQFIQKEVPFRTEFVINDISYWLAGIISAIAICSLINAYLFSRAHFKKEQISKGRAFGAYMLVVLIANLAYLVFAFSYAFLVGAL